jgi:4-aminobutyrate aminotransferase-like enzyme
VIAAVMVAGPSAAAAAGQARLARLAAHLPTTRRRAGAPEGSAAAGGELGDSKLFNRALTATPPLADHADGIYVTDTNGRQYVDFGSGIAVTNIGQNVEYVKDKIKAQLDTATFIYNGHFSNTPAEEAADLLLRMCPEGGTMAAGRVLFCNSGSEGNEIALKLCRQYHNERGHPEKYKVISRFRAYHGNTLAAAALSDRPTWTNQFEPYLNRDAFPLGKMACPNTYRQSGLDAHELEQIILKEVRIQTSRATALTDAGLPFYRRARTRCPRSSQSPSQAHRCQVRCRPQSTSNKCGKSATNMMCSSLRMK